MGSQEPAGFEATPGTADRPFCLHCNQRVYYDVCSL